MADNIKVTPGAAEPQVSEEQIDLEQIKSMLDLPATATDLELITVLVQLIANLQAKYEALLQDAVAMEDTVTNRAIEDFADIIDEASAPFWKEQLLVNRSLAIDTLTKIREKIVAGQPAPAMAPEPETRSIPLRNRLAATPRSLAHVASSSPVVVTERDNRAVMIRNRAHEIAKSDKIPFILAFARAETEFNKE